MKPAIVSNHIVHAPDRAGFGGVVTRCRVVVRKETAAPATISFGSGFPTSPQGWPCKVCFGKEQK